MLAVPLISLGDGRFLNEYEETLLPTSMYYPVGSLY